MQIVSLRLDAKGLWIEMLDCLMGSKKEAAWQVKWCAQDMEWVRPYMQGMVKSSYG